MNKILTLTLMLFVGCTAADRALINQVATDFARGARQGEQRAAERAALDAQRRHYDAQRRYYEAQRLQTLYGGQAQPRASDCRTVCRRSFGGVVECRTSCD